MERVFRICFNLLELALRCSETLGPVLIYLVRAPSDSDTVDRGLNQISFMDRNGGARIVERKAFADGICFYGFPNDRRGY